MRKFVLVGFGAVLAIALGLVVQHQAEAKQGDTIGYGYPVAGLVNVATNAAAGLRTFTNDNVQGFTAVQFWFSYDWTSTGAAFTLTCTGGPSEKERDYTLTVCAGSSAEGECTAASSGILKSDGTLGADSKWDGILGLRGAHSFSCVMVPSAGAADEFISIKYELFAQ